MPQECGRLDVGKLVILIVSKGFRAVNFEFKHTDVRAVFPDLDNDLIRPHEDVKALQISVLVCLCHDVSI